MAVIYIVPNMGELNSEAKQLITQNIFPVII